MTSEFKGISYMCLAMLTFVTVNTIAKDVVAVYPLTQVTFFRTFFSLFPCLVLLRQAGGVSALKTQHLPRYILIGSVGTVALIGLFGSLRLLPLADAVCLHFSETLFLTAFCAWFLKEKAGSLRWSAVLVGFAGVLVVMRPTGDILNLGAIYALTFALGDAFVMMNARILTRTDHSVIVVTYFSAVVSVLTGLTLPFYWQMPGMMDLLLLIFLGLGGGLGQLFVTFAYRHAPAATVAPMIYTALLWAVLFGYIFWGEIPDLTLILGGALIVSSGLFIIYRETRKQVEVTVQAPGMPHEKNNP
ncbi:MAG: DMT family transporter [Pseudomonadota bacterium]